MRPLIAGNRKMHGLIAQPAEIEQINAIRVGSTGQQERTAGTSP
jgi:hypothetical protein